VDRPAAPDRGEGRQDDLEWVVVPDPGWSADPSVVGTRRCRFTVETRPGSRVYRSHGVSAAAVLYRPYGEWARRPWAYCVDHLFGRWIEGGEVVGWRLRRRAA